VNEGEAASLVLGSRAPLPKIVVEQLCAPAVFIFLDFDGTLVPICDMPGLARLDPETKEVLRALRDKPRFRIAIVSGRDRAFLEAEFAGLEIDIAAEHGAAFLGRGSPAWRVLGKTARGTDRTAIMEIMVLFRKDFIGCFIEEKEFGLALHYRNAVDVTEEALQALVDDLSHLAGEACVLSGRKIVEVCLGGVNKGSFVRWYLSAHAGDNAEPPGVISIGDDTTDEFMFREAALRRGTAIHVGTNRTGAVLTLESQPEVVPLLREFARFG
jgi:trehalose 6-phosphate synthase/phosphatase